MRVPSKAQAWLLGTLIVGGGVIAAAVVLRRGDVSTATLALLAAAVVLAEMLQVEGDETSPDPGDVHSLSFSSTIHLATALIIGPWTAAVVAAFGVLVVDPMRGAPWRVVAYNASVFGLAAAVGGHVFLLAGGVPGSLELPASFPAIAALAVAYYLVNYAFQSAIVGLHRGRSLLVLMRDASRDGLPAAVGEAGLAVAIAFFAFHEPLAIVALAPLMFAVYRSYERLATMRRETARALETFANVVDERDSSTYEHSARVADLVNRLAEALDLPQSDVARLRWAGRLHDLGKISVDAAVLRKPSRLDDDEWATMRLHPRLSARLLRRFRFAADQAKAVEYHHERFDGLGYYGIDPDEIPMAAHFLIVADSFDAMTSDRAYRAGLPREVALAEIEKHAGTQFHPAVAKAFLALERRQDPRGVLTREELRALRRAFRSRRRPALPLRRVFTLDRVMGGAVIAGLTAVAVGGPLTGAPILALGLVALAFDWFQAFRAHVLTAAIRGGLAPAPNPSAAFAALSAVLPREADVAWLGLVAWHERDCRGSLEEAWKGSSSGPGETALTSWLLREAESDGSVLVAQRGELESGHVHLAVPLRGPAGLGGYLVVSTTRSSHRLERALSACSQELADRLTPLAASASPRLEAVAS